MVCSWSGEVGGVFGGGGGVDDMFVVVGCVGEGWGGWVLGGFV